MDIKQALASLDPADDELWTSDGSPRVDAVSAILGHETTRGAITEADPMLSRSNASAPDEPVQRAAIIEPTPIGDSGEPEVVVPIDPDVKIDVKATEPELEPEQAQPAPDPTKMSDADASACVEIFDDVIGMKPADVFRSRELCERASAEFARMSEVLTARGEAITKKIKEVGSRSAIVTTALNRLGGTTDQSQKDLKAYLKSQNDIRAKRKSTALAFLAAGTTAKDVADELRGASPLDAALNARQKPAIGSQRPAPRLPT